MGRPDREVILGLCFLRSKGMIDLEKKKNWAVAGQRVSSGKVEQHVS
jgi:hypothetical protein